MKYLLLFVAYLLTDIPGNGEKNVYRVPLDGMKKVRIDDHLQGIWKLREDTDMHNYFVLEKSDDLQYSITYMNKSGDNRGLEHGGAFFTEIGGERYLHVTNWDWEHPGMVMLKVKEITSPRSWNMTACLVTDTNLHRMKTAAQLNAYIEKNRNSPGFYGADLHFRKKFEFNSFGPSK